MRTCLNDLQVALHKIEVEIIDIVTCWLANCYYKKTMHFMVCIK